MSVKTPNTPYYAVIFTSISKLINEEYSETARLMEELATQQTGFLGLEHAREQIGITVSYWQDLESIKRWKNQSQHIIAQDKGKNEWYKSYSIRICKVEKEYHFNNEN